MNVLDNKYIISSFVFIVGIVGYLTNIYPTIGSVMLVMGILGLMANYNEWSNPNSKTINIIVLSSIVVFLNSIQISQNMQPQKKTPNI